jgi:hypothetical protein
VPPALPLAQHHWPTKVFGCPLPRCWMLPSRMCRSAALPRTDHSPRNSTGRLALRALKAFMSLSKAPAGSVTQCPPKLNSHNHNQHAGRPCFSLAVLIERPTSTPRYDISRLRNQASHVSAHAIHGHVDGSSLHRSTTAEPSCTRCKQSARPATRMTIGRHCMRRPPHDLLSWACRFRFRSSFDCGSTTDVAELRICAMRVALRCNKSPTTPSANTRSGDGLHYIWSCH